MTRQSYLEEFARSRPDLSALSPAQQRAYEAVELQGVGVREFARKTGRSPGTVGNLLRRARDRLDDARGGDSAT